MSDIKENNQIKYQNYREQKNRLKKAINNEFYIEALAIEYAILEERTAAVLKYAGIDFISAKGIPLSLSRKLNKIKTCSPFTGAALRKKIPVEIIERAAVWKSERDSIMHGLLVRNSDTEEFRTQALEGLVIIKEIDNASKRVKRYFNKIEE